MSTVRQIKGALISVYHKENLAPIVDALSKIGATIYSTGGTLSYIEELGVKATSVESLTGYPSILGGRVKTLHPKVFGGILNRRSSESDLQQLQEHQIPSIDLVIVDLYPFEETVSKGGSESEVIEKIDIGGVSLIRAAAKNFNDVLVVSAQNQYPKLLKLLYSGDGSSTLEERKSFALEAFMHTSQYDTAIFSYFAQDSRNDIFNISVEGKRCLRYGENPHQKGSFFGNFNEMLEPLHGKEISYNNLLDIDAAIGLIADFSEPTIAILKHNNACGIASRKTLSQAWRDALASDPVSAFGGVIITNRMVDVDTANEMDKLFFEVVLAPDFNDEALAILSSKKNRIIVRTKSISPSTLQYRSLLGGVLVQDVDLKTERASDLRVVTLKQPTAAEVEDLLFANRIVKHSKSNAIVLAKNGQLIASGVGETSRVDALKHAIEKAKSFGMNLKGAAMASDAFFPFADCVEIAFNEGISTVIQPGGSLRDNDSIDFCNANGMSMVFTGIRHFKH
jgi:phosphoribosylaminoimidazolecarboxamide formyltransferase/IMP cyclohydrolase